MRAPEKSWGDLRPTLDLPLLKVLFQGISQFMMNEECKEVLLFTIFITFFYLSHLLLLNRPFTILLDYFIYYLIH